MFTAPKFKIGDIVYDNNTTDCTPYKVVSFHPNEEKGGYNIGFQKDDETLMERHESYLVSKDNAIFIVQEDWATEDETVNSVLLATKDFEKAKKCFDERVKAELDFENKEEKDWTIDQDETIFSAYEDGYYDTAHYNISITAMELE